jgi:hypothetical protein
VEREVALVIPVFLSPPKHSLMPKLLLVVAADQTLMMAVVTLTAALAAATLVKMVKGIPTPTVKVERNLPEVLEA